MFCTFTFIFAVSSQAER